MRGALVCHSYALRSLILPMCCFSRPVEHVSNTSIFARPVANGRQALIYSMELKAGEDLAMILPIPVVQPAREDAVQFVSMKDIPEIFKEMASGFERLDETMGIGRGPAPAAALGPRLRVVEVGNFAASFVPTVKDFNRLDEQFRLPSGVWEKLGEYAQHGFAVFKLRKGHTQVHPMAFTFPSADPKRLFFPTVHIHDGRIHPSADFDHALYCQVARRGVRSLATWDESPEPAGHFLRTHRTRNFVLPDLHLYRRKIIGQFANKDVLMPIG
jgi:hypothetical protein